MLKRNKNVSQVTSLHHLMFILQQSSDEVLLAELGIGLSHVRIMGTLNTSVARSQRAIAKALRQTEANISRQIRIMARQGLVNITKNKKDARQKDVTLTAKGANQYTKAEEVLNLHYKNLLRVLSVQESVVFHEATHKLTRHLHSS